MEFATLHKTNKKLTFRAEQMYSQSLTKRRNIVMNEGKTSIESKTVSSYLSFPATLMVKKNTSDKKYVSHNEF